MVIRNAFWLSLCRGAADVLSFVLFAAIARHFGPAGSGEYSYAFTLATLIAIVGGSGLAEYGVREYVRAATGAPRRQFWQALLSAQVAQLAGGLLLLAAVLCAHASNPAAMASIAELALFLVGWQMSRALFVPAMAAQHMAAPATIELACRGAATLSALAAIALGVQSLPAVLAGFPLAAIVLVALSLRSAVAHGAPLKVVMRVSGLHAAARSAGPFMLCDLMGQLYARTDLLVLAFLLGNASVGLYATDIKFVEVGVSTLFLLGMAAYPVLSGSAARDMARFREVTHDFLHTALLVGGWLAIGILYLVPLVVPPLFGPRFAAATALLPGFALLAAAKGIEVAAYRALYALRLQHLYVKALIAGTLTALASDFILIPHFGVLGAIGAGLAGIAVVISMCVMALRRHVPGSMFGFALARLAGAIGLTVASVVLFDGLEVDDSYEAITACLLFPAFAFACGLVPRPRSLLFGGSGELAP